MNTTTFQELNKHSRLGTKFQVSGCDTIFVFDTCQLIRNGSFTALNTKFNTNSKIGASAKLILVN